MERLDLAYTKADGQSLSAQEWNTIIGGLQSKTNNIVDALNSGAGTTPSGSGSAVDSSHMYVNDKGNLCIETNTTNTPAGKKGKINIESNDDIQLKPGDDIILYSHHRGEGKTDEVAVKVTDGDDVPVKLQLNASEILLTSKDKPGDNPDVMDVTVNSDKNTRGYLKVRAQAIDLRSESHGGIALQPKGTDSQGHMNKIKFEHGGGDGLEFGTFNAEKTSIFTDEYRFNRDGVWKMATRTKVASDKADITDPTTSYKYVKAEDDFYDNIAQDDEQCRTKDIIKTAYALNGSKSRHAKVTNKGAIEIATEDTYSVVIEETPSDLGSVVNISTIAKNLAEFSNVADGNIFNSGDFNTLPVESTIYTNNTQYFSFTIEAAPSIKIDSGSELKLGGILDFGSSFNFGETDNGIEFQYKLTKKNATKDCGVLKVVGVNNHETNTLTVEGVTIQPGDTAEIASCSVLDIIKLVNYMKDNNQGPWETV